MNSHIIQTRNNLLLSLSLSSYFLSSLYPLSFSLLFSYKSRRSYSYLKSALYSVSFSSPIKLQSIFLPVKLLKTASHMADAKDSSMVEAKSSGTTLTPTSTQQHRTLMMAQDILRILAILLSATSIAVMVTNNQTVFLFMIRFEAHFYYSSSFKFLVAANGIVFVFSVLTLIINLLLRKQASQRKYFYFFLFVHDIVMTVLLISGCAAATAIGYVGKFGEEHVGWQPICDHVAKFCKTNLVSLLISYLAFFAYLGLTILMAYKCISSSPKN